MSSLTYVTKIKWSVSLILTTGPALPIILLNYPTFFHSDSSVIKFIQGSLNIWGSIIFLFILYMYFFVDLIIFFSYKFLKLYSFLEYRVFLIVNYIMQNFSALIFFLTQKNIDYHHGENVFWSPSREREKKPTSQQPIKEILNCIYRAGEQSPFLMEPCIGVQLFFLQPIESSTNTFLWWASWGFFDWQDHWNVFDAGHLLFVEGDSCPRKKLCLAPDYLVLGHHDP